MLKGQAYMMVLIDTPMALPTEKNKNESSRRNKMDEMEVVLRRFGDEQSALLDQFERLSFEVQLNQAILRRSLSEPSVAKSEARPLPASVPVLPLVTTQVRQGRRGKSGFGKVLKKLLKPILSRKGKTNNTTNNKKNSSNGGKKEVPDPKSLKYCKAFSRSLRF